MKILIFSSIILLFSVQVDAQIVNIPDAQFKAHLVGDPLINTNLDAEIQTSEATAFSGTINCSNASISDLTGIETFTTLTSLNCQDNQLTALDITQNTALNTLRCSENQLIALDVSQSPSLDTLDCSNNQLTFLNISQNSNLVYLWCSYNQISSLDLSQNTALTQIYCRDNELTSLNVSPNAALERLNCGINQLTSLDVSQNTSLFILTCSRNQLTSLDVSQNPNLNNLWCFENQLECLNVKNGNNIGLGTNFSAVLNTNLTCIEVDDPVWASSNWTVSGSHIDATMTFSANCSNSCSTVGITEISNLQKKLLKIIDPMGRETLYAPNTLQIYLYSDGTTRKVFRVD